MLCQVCFSTVLLGTSIQIKLIPAHASHLLTSCYCTVLQKDTTLPQLEPLICSPMSPLHGLAVCDMVWGTGLPGDGLEGMRAQRDHLQQPHQRL